MQNQYLMLAACLILFLLVRRRLRRLAAQVGLKALERQPDTIELRAVRANQWKNAALAESAAEDLAENGFEDAGVYRIEQLPEMTLRLLANPAESLYAVFYEHARAGTWMDIVACYQDHTSVTFTTSRATGLQPRPGHRTVHVPGASATALCERALRDMPDGALRPASVSRAVKEFEDAWAESMAWRKAHGVSPEEVAAVARRKAA